MQYCSLHHHTLLPSPVTTKLGSCFHFGSVSSLFLELFLHSSPVAYWAPTDLGSSSFSILSFCLFMLFMGFSRQEYWSGLPFPSPVDHVLSELYTMTCLSWMAIHGMAHSFIELGPKLWSMWSDWFVFCDCGFQFVCPRLAGASALPLDVGYLLTVSSTMQPLLQCLMSYWVFSDLGRRISQNHNHRKLTNLTTWTTALSNSMKLWAMSCRDTQDGWVMVESSDKMWSTGEGNGKLLQYSSLRTPWTVWKGKKIGHWKKNYSGQ